MLLRSSSNGVSMRRMNVLPIAALVALALVAGCASAPSGPVTAYEGARLIVGDGSVIENGTLLVGGDKIVQAGRDVRVPDGATRVNLAGKTVMPMIVDTHVHLSNGRDALVRDLRRRAYRSEERRVGKECRGRSSSSPSQEKHDIATSRKEL